MKKKKKSDDSSPLSWDLNPWLGLSHSRIYKLYNLKPSAPSSPQVHLSPEFTLSSTPSSQIAHFVLTCIWFTPSSHLVCHWIQRCKSNSIATPDFNHWSLLNWMCHLVMRGDYGWQAFITLWSTGPFFTQNLSLWLSSSLHWLHGIVQKRLGLVSWETPLGVLCFSRYDGLHDLQIDKFCQVQW